ncbi:hypothetical protein KBI23_06725 [bacterium]|nr:hypothetical protein [bacterium]MBP9810973.1 hypothetical protein [bacterium]
MRLIAMVILGSALLFAVLYGGFIAGIVLREPDVCFLLAMGRWMAQHGQIPAVDPFSYTYLAFPNGNAYVVYQWLSEVILYAVQSLAGPIALLVFTAVLQGITFVVIPLRLFALAGGNIALGSFFVFLVTLASLSHPSVRPEMFSFLMTAVLLELLARLARRGSGKAIDWYFVAFAFLLQVLWTNLHCLFIFYFILVGFFAICLGSYSLVKKEKLDGHFRTAVAAFLAGALATLINPYSFSIWPFTFLMLSDPINKTINELRPMSFAVLNNVLNYPWFLLAILSLVVFLFSLRKKVTSGEQLYFLLLTPAAILMSFLAVRTFPLAALLMSCAIAFSALMKPADGKLAQLGRDCQSVIAPLSLMWLLSISTFCGFGAYLLAAKIIPPTIPQGSAAFHPPFDAIRFLENDKSSPLKRNMLKGNMLNDAHYGAVMMWQMANPPKVFVDPRYFLYNVQIMNDYWDMVLYRNKPEALLDKYKISWVFLPSTSALARELSGQPSWQLLYSDTDAVILARNKWQNDSAFLP